MFFWKRLKYKHFPKVIMPRRHYLLKIDVKSMYDALSIFFVARRLNGNMSSCTEQRNGKCFLKLDSLGEVKHLSQFSLDLLGARYLPEKHQRYRTTGKGSDRWDGKTVFCHVPQEFYTYWEKECSSVAFEASHIISIPMPYQKNLNREQFEKLISRGINLGKFLGKQKYNLTGEFRLEHEPTMVNYWHFQANFYPSGEEKPMEGERKGWKGEVIDFLVQFLLATPVQPITLYTMPSISSKYYKK